MLVNEEYVNVCRIHRDGCRDIRSLRSLRIESCLGVVDPFDDETVFVDEVPPVVVDRQLYCREARRGCSARLYGGVVQVFPVAVPTSMFDDLVFLVEEPHDEL